MGTIESIAVIGAGTMGHGIAHVSAIAGYRVGLFDAVEGAAGRGLERVRDNLDKGISRGKVTEAERDAALSRLRACATLGDAVRDADLVIEAAPESMDIKAPLFRDLDKLAPPASILATNTSSLSIGRIAGETTRPSQVIGMHFFNPVHVMKLLEVVVHDRVSDGTRASVLDVAHRLGKEPIVVRDAPGFASSRLGIALGLEAMRMLEQGVASAADIDKAMELGYNHPMGPLRLTDLVGLDVRLSIAEYLHKELGSESFRPPELLRRMVAEGKLGKKSGEGFYSW
ncbi:MAG TPA: 3-hydroxyacyl-CoA dehydrogenase family protein [Blastocatellia bacterium]|nr:3-hydroxyacyl-CoA dehydrogenase family protein [Blastocatellia bacterium]